MYLKYFLLISLTCANLVQPSLNLLKRNAKKGKNSDIDSFDFIEFPDPVPEETVSSTLLETEIASPQPSATVTQLINRENGTTASSPSSSINREVSNMFPKLPDETNKTLLFSLVAIASVILLLATVFLFYRIRVNKLKSEDEWNSIKKSKSHSKDSFQVVPTLEFLPRYEPEYHSQFKVDNSLERSSVVPLSLSARGRDSASSFNDRYSFIIYPTIRHQEETPQ